ncbi:MAG: ATPase, partial [bacterium]
MSPIDFPKVYNPALQTPQELIDSFVVRTKLFQEIFEDIKNSEMKYPEQHYIIQGIRGQGKTTLLLRIAYEINRDARLRKKIIPIIFNEEQYNISRLYKLWETTSEYLEEYNEITGLYDEMQKLPIDDQYEFGCFQILEDALKKNKKKIILFIDNIDEMLNKFSRTEHHRLREIFIESAELRVIGASSVSLEFHHDYGKPFYQFFRMPQLNGLSSDETKTLLLKLGEQYKRDRVKEIVESQPGRIEALRRLTGGVIRTIIILFQIFVDDQDGNAFRDLEKILDGVSPLYKHRMDKLAPQQQEIIDFIALNWDAVSTKEIAQKTKLQSKAISAQLKQLEKYHIIEKERTDTKNFLYRIHERFFNIWYLMRQGRKEDERRVRFLVEFLQIWCDEKELESRTLKHLQSLKSGRMYEQQAFYMTEALARTPIPSELQHRLIAETRQYLDQCHSEMKTYLSKSDQELKLDAKKALSSQDIKSAIKAIERIKNK